MSEGEKPLSLRVEEQLRTQLLVPAAVKALVYEMAVRLERVELQLEARGQLSQPGAEGLPPIEDRPWPMPTMKT